MRHKVDYLATKHSSEPAEPSDYLIADQIEIVLGADLRDRGEIASRWHDHAAGPHHRLGNEGRDCVGIFGDDHRFELGGEPGRELLLGLALVREAIVMRACGVADVGDRHVEVDLIVGQAGERRRCDRNAVIRFDAADNLLPARPSERVVHVPDKLDLGVVRLRAGVAEEHLGDRHRRDLLEPFGELDRRIMTFGAEQMRERELAHLRSGSVDQFFVTVAKRRAPQAGHALDVGFAIGVIDIDALRALDHQWSGCAKLVEVGVRVDQRLNVANGKVAGHGATRALGECAG